jgi:hypothetical protein
VAEQYGTSIGRFIQPDPIASSINNPQSLNRYVYALNDPVNLVDPLGLNPDNVTVLVDGVETSPGIAMVLLENRVADVESYTMGGVTRSINKNRFYEYKNWFDMTGYHVATIFNNTAS